MAEQVEKLVTLLELQNRDVLRKLNQVEKATQKTFDGSRGPLKRFNADMRKSGDVAREVATALGTAFAGGLFAGGITGIVAGVRDVARGVAEIGDQAQRAGLSVEAFQELGYVAAQNRIPIDSLIDGMKELSLRADEFVVTGAGPAAEAFGRIGLRADELREKLKDPMDLLAEIIDRVKGLDRAAQIRIFDELLGGTGGERFVELIDLGGDGLRRLAEEARTAGVVVSRELIEKAAEVDREFNKLWIQFETYSKSAVIKAVSYLDQLESFTRRLSDSFQEMLPDALAQERAGMILHERLGGGLFGGRDVNRGMFFRDDIGAPTTRPAEITVRPYDVKAEQEARKAATGEAERQEAAYQRVVDALQLEQSQIGQTATQIRIMNELQSAGIDIDDKRAQKIIDLATNIESAKEAQERFNEVAQFAGDHISGMFSDMISGAATFEESMARVAQSIADAALQAALLGQGPLAGLFGTTPTGGDAVGGLLGLLFDGFRADGGPVASGKAYMVGEKGPEFFVPRSAGAIVPANSGGGGGATYAPTTYIDARGSQMTEAQFRAIVEENNRRVVPQIAVAAVGNANRVSTNPAFRTR